MSLDTLREIVAGWAEVGAADEPQYTSDVASVTSVSTTVGRQTRFLEEISVLDPHRQQHALTEAGQAFTGTLADGDEERARPAARDLLADWSLTEDVRGVVEDNPIAESGLAPVVADPADEDLDVDWEDLEAIVRGLREGLTEADE